ncbi:MAG TPA: ATP-binding cassette domain-containing protein [Streptosporangiaceae bacterium]|nr:ATP-binding cassette domain-containing protein [Streptosporangiaceae bacterium]
MVLRIEDLVVDFPVAHRRPKRAVDHVSLEMRAGEILGIVGESGSGKTTMARLVAGFLQPTSGTVMLPGPGGTLSPRSGTRGHRDVQMVFQQSAVSMNPRMPVWKVIGEAYSPNCWMSKGRSLPKSRDGGAAVTLEAAVKAQLRRVGLPESYSAKRAVELSGGEKQRVVIARALAAQPVIIVCDEPVSSLDVSIRAVILNLFERLRDDLGMALFFISHDISVVAHLADRVIVMHDGKAVESGPAREVIDNPQDEYTRRLIASVPSLERGNRSDALRCGAPRTEVPRGESPPAALNTPGNTPHERGAR